MSARVRPPSTAPQWKVQPDRTEAVGPDAARTWWLPLWGAPKKRRHPKHRVWGTINLLNSALFGGFAAECILRGWSRVELPSTGREWCW